MDIVQREAYNRHIANEILTLLGLMTVPLLRILLHPDSQNSNLGLPSTPDASAFDSSLIVAGSSSSGGGSSSVGEDSKNSGLQTPITIKNPSSLLLKPFPYHDDLFHLGISPTNWTTISNSICSAASMTFKQCAVAIGTGVALDLSFGTGAGIVTGREIARRQRIKNVRKSLAADGPLNIVMEKWNSELFSPRGLRMGVVLPSGSLERENHATKGRAEDQKVSVKTAERTSDVRHTTILQKKHARCWVQQLKEKRQWNIVIENVLQDDGESVVSSPVAELSGTVDWPIAELSSHLSPQIAGSPIHIPRLAELPVGVVELADTEKSQITQTTVLWNEPSTGDSIATATSCQKAWEL